MSVFPHLFFSVSFIANLQFSLVGIGFTTAGKQIQLPNIKIIQKHCYF